MKTDERTFVTGNSAGSKLASADYHGAEVTVVRSKCMGMVGLAGIVVRDTKFTFQIVTKKNELKSKFYRNSNGELVLTTLTVLAIPKKHMIFRFEIPQPESTQNLNEEPASAKTKDESPRLVFELHGSQFENRAPDRATKKFKQRNMNDL